MKRERKLSSIIIIICVVFGLLLSFGIGIIGYKEYSNGMTEKYQLYLSNLLDYVSSSIDADNIDMCLHSEEINERFLEDANLLDNIKEQYDIAYLYVIKPLNTEVSDNVMNIMFGETEEEKNVYKETKEEQFSRLTGTDYSPEIAKEFLDAMMSNEEYTYIENFSEYGYMYSAIKPLKNSSGETIAVLGADIDMLDVINTKKSYVLYVSVGGIILTLIFVIIQMLMLNKRVVHPIEKLNAAAKQYVNQMKDMVKPEELSFNMEKINSHDEIECLTDSVFTLSDSVKKYMTDIITMSKEKERIGAELNVATEIQSSYLPSLFPPFPDRHEFDIFATMCPAKEVGGDFYDFFFIDHDHLALVIADVSGKGVGAAMFMMISKTFLNGQAHIGNSPAEILQEVNNRLCESNKAEMFVTVWLGILDIKTGKITASNGGHEYPFIQRAGGEYELFKDKHGLALGAYPGVKYSEYEIQLNKGDAIFVYTDGVAEATDAENELFGTDRALEALNRSPEIDMKQAIIIEREAIDAFVKDAPQFDDITMLALRYLGSE